MFLSHLFKAVRPHHWAKNLLIFLPAIMSHLIFDPIVLKNAILAFFSFSFVASTGYLINDIIDFNSDKKNEYKAKRPLASGTVSKNIYLVLAVCLFVAAIILSFAISRDFLMILLIYFVLSLSYSYFLKSILALDVLVLAGFYALRVFAGSVATNVSVSEWLLSFCLFFFLSLALGKRATELNNTEVEVLSNRRAYQKSDLNILSQIGVCLGLLSVLVLAFYVTSTHVATLYSTPKILWGLCFILIYWITRFWILVSQGKVEEDPVVFALKDLATYISAILIAVTIIISV